MNQVCAICVCTHRSKCPLMGCALRHIYVYLYVLLGSEFSGVVIAVKGTMPSGFWYIVSSGHVKVVDDVPGADNLIISTKLPPTRAKGNSNSKPTTLYLMNKSKEKTLISPGGHFGEENLVNNVPYKFSFVAKDRASVIHVKKEGFDEVLAAIRASTPQGINEKKKSFGALSVYNIYDSPKNAKGTNGMADNADGDMPSSGAYLSPVATNGQQVLSLGSGGGSSGLDGIDFASATPSSDPPSGKRKLTQQQKDKLRQAEKRDIVSKESQVDNCTLCDVLAGGNPALLL
jgi:hypothetical protein